MFKEVDYKENEVAPFRQSYFFVTLFTIKGEYN